MTFNFEQVSREHFLRRKEAIANTEGRIRDAFNQAKKRLEKGRKPFEYLRNAFNDITRKEPFIDLKSLEPAISSLERRVDEYIRDKFTEITRDQKIQIMKETARKNVDSLVLLTDSAKANRQPPIVTDLFKLLFDTENLSGEIIKPETSRFGKYSSKDIDLTLRNLLSDGLVNSDDYSILRILLREYIKKKTPDSTKERQETINYLTGIGISHQYASELTSKIPPSRLPDRRNRMEEIMKSKEKVNTAINENPNILLMSNSEFEAYLENQKNETKSSNHTKEPKRTDKSFPKKDDLAELRKEYVREISSYGLNPETAESILVDGFKLKPSTARRFMGAHKISLRTIRDFTKMQFDNPSQPSLEDYIKYFERINAVISSKTGGYSINPDIPKIRQEYIRNLIARNLNSN